MINIVCKAYYETLVKDLAFLNFKSGGEGNLTWFLCIIPLMIAMREYESS